MKQLCLLILALSLAGCGTMPEPQVRVQAIQPSVSAASAGPSLQVAAPDPDAVASAVSPAEAPPWEALRAIAAQGGLVGDWQSLQTEATGYETQLLPSSTQEQAETLAHQWARDARQAYIGWGFWKTPLLGSVRHTYYSASKQLVLKLEYSLTRHRLKRTEEDGSDFKKAFLVLRDAYDIHGYTATQAYARARSAGYRPGKVSMAALLHLVFFGPVWVFMDDATLTPTVVVRADSGDVVTDGPLMWAVTYLVKHTSKG